MLSGLQDRADAPETIAPPEFLPGGTSTSKVRKCHGQNHDHYQAGPQYLELIRADKPCAPAQDHPRLGIGNDMSLEESLDNRRSLLERETPRHWRLAPPSAH